MTMKQPYYNTEVTKMTNKKSILTVSLLIIFLLTAFCISAGCIFSEPDPVVGTYVYTKYNDPSTNANPNQGPVVGSFRHTEDAVKFYENGKMLYSFYVDGRVAHFNSTWTKKDNRYYVRDASSYLENFSLSSDANTLVLVSALVPDSTNEILLNISYIRNDSYVIPDECYSWIDG